MKRLFTLAMAVCGLAMSASAQTYIWKNGSTVLEFPESAPDSVTFNKSTKTTSAVAVDLGLPSGTKWADRNVGASCPGDFGDYFAWGEVEPKDEYTDETYKYYVGKITEYFHCTKTNDEYGYCEEGEWNTNPDGADDSRTGVEYSNEMTTLDAEHDAATVNWGKGWRMPTGEQMKELKDECEWLWCGRIDSEGYVWHGFKVTGPNGNSIFLPAAGFRDDGYLESGAGHCGNYLQSSLKEGSTSDVLYTYFDQFTLYEHYIGKRYVGRSVRPVAE